MSCNAHLLAATRAFLNYEDVDHIQDLVRMLPSRHVEVVDLGAGSGTTAMAVLEIRDSNIRVTSRDISAENLGWAELALKNIGKSPLWRGLHGKSDSDPYKCDLLLVDACHEYECVKEDLLAWVPWMSQGGLVWCHDYRPPQLYPGVAKAINEVEEQLGLLRLSVQGLSWSGVKR